MLLVLSLRHHSTVLVKLVLVLREPLLVLVLPWLTLSLPMLLTQLMLTVLQVSQQLPSQPEFQSVSQSPLAVNKYT